MASGVEHQNKAWKPRSSFVSPETEALRYIIALHYTTLHYIALHCILHYITLHYIPFHAYIRKYVHMYSTYIHYIHNGACPFLYLGTLDSWARNRWPLRCRACWARRGTSQVQALRPHQSHVAPGHTAPYPPIHVYMSMRVYMCICVCGVVCICIRMCLYPCLCI